MKRAIPVPILLFLTPVPLRAADDVRKHHDILFFLVDDMGVTDTSVRFLRDPPQMAVEVESVRLVAPNLAIEDGAAHFTPGDDEEAPTRSVTYLIPPPRCNQRACGMTS